MYKFIFTVLLTIISFSNLNAEIIKKIDISGNVRVSDETIKIYGEIKLNSDYNEQKLNSIINNSISGRIRALDEMPFPNYEHFINMPYNWKFDMYGIEDTPIFTMHTSRSCPYRCSFCGVAAIWTRKWTSFSAERIVKEIDLYVEKYGCK